jgi:hypothetical protein
MTWTTIHQTMLEQNKRDAEKLQWLLRPADEPHRHQCPACDEKFECRNGNCAGCDHPMCRRCWVKHVEEIDYERGVAKWI